MKKLLLSQKGFTAFEVVLIVLVLAATGTAGYFAYQSNQDKTDYSVPTSKSKQTNVKSISGDPITRVKELYELYIPEATKIYYTENVAMLKTKGYILADFGNTGGGGDPVLCGQGVVPKSVEVSLISKTDSEATLAVTKVHEDGSKEDEITVVVAANTSNQWALKKVSCKTPS